MSESSQTPRLGSRSTSPVIRRQVGPSNNNQKDPQTSVAGMAKIPTYNQNSRHRNVWFATPIIHTTLVTRKTGIDEYVILFGTCMDT